MILLKWLYRILLIMTMMAGVCKFSTMPVRLMSTECAVTLGSYFVLLLFTQHIYKATDVGLVTVSELVLSQMLTNLISIGVAYLGVAIYQHHLFNPLPLCVVWLIQLVLGVLWSLLTNYVYFHNRQKPHTVIIYKNEALLEQLCRSPYFDDKYDVCRLIENPANDSAELRRQLADCEVLFTVGIASDITNTLAKLCLDMNIVGYFMPGLGNIILSGAEYNFRFNVPMLRAQRAGGHSEYRFIKRTFDLCFASLALIVLTPLMLVVASAIWLEDRGPVFYRQVRLTRGGREFNILKFRSMTVNAEKDGVARLAGENDSRITKVGRFIRACRIDELPQLLNIIKGEMSIVGPRPERPEIARQYEETLPEFALRLQVKAGLTGRAQVCGRYNTEPYHKLQMDLMYINEMSVVQDLQLIMATIKILFIKDSTQGIAQGQQTAMNQNQADQTKSA